MRAIYFIWLRPVRKFLRERVRIGSSLIQPLLFLVSLGYGLGAVYRDAGRGSAVDFVTPGILAMTVMSSSTSSGLELVLERRSGFLQELFVSPLPRLSIMAGRLLGSATVCALQAILVLAVFWIAGFRSFSITSVLAIMPVVMLVSFLYTSFGSIIAAFQKDPSNFEIIISTTIAPMFFLSGALFPLSGVPKFLMFLSRFDPLTYGVDMLRFILVGSGFLSFRLDCLVLCGVAGSLTILAAWLVSRMEL